MISVVIPLYNKEKQIKRTLQSVLTQTFQDFEIVIVNDGSTDNSTIEVEKIKDSRIRLIHQENAGVSAARNKGIEEAKYELIALLDADDEWKNKYLEVQYDLYKKYPKCDIFACNYEFVNEKHDISPTIIKKLSFKENDGILNNYFEVACVSHPPLCSSAIVIKKKAIQAIGGFPLGIKSGEDLLTWAKLATFYQIAYNKLAYAQFNIEGYLLNEKPKRIPAPIDVVGNELLRLLRQQPKPYLRQYLSHWHKMRSSIYMRLSMRKESINEAIVGLKYNPKNYKLYIYSLLNLIPSKLRPF